MQAISSRLSLLYILCCTSPCVNSWTSERLVACQRDYQLLLKYSSILCSSEDKSRRLSTCPEYCLLQVLITAWLFTSSMCTSCISSRNSSVSVQSWMHVCCVSVCCISSSKCLIHFSGTKLAELIKLLYTRQVHCLTAWAIVQTGVSTITMTGSRFALWARSLNLLNYRLCRLFWNRVGNSEILGRHCHYCQVQVVTMVAKPWFAQVQTLLSVLTSLCVGIWIAARNNNFCSIFCVHNHQISCQ